jgi:GAF domain
MAARMQPTAAGTSTASSTPRRRRGAAALALLGFAAAVAAAVIGWNGGLGRGLGWLLLAPVWVVAITLAARRVRATPRRTDRARGDVVALSFALAVMVVVVASTLHVLVGWPPRLLQFAAAATGVGAVALVVRLPRRFEPIAARAVGPAISLAGVTTLVVGVYLLVVVGLGRPPTHEERTVLVLSLIAAGASALLYTPARRRLSLFSNRLRDERRSTDEVVRVFRATLSRAVPLEELLLQLAESLRRALALDAAEVWTRSEGGLERVASDPDRGPDSMLLNEPEASVLARSGVSGPGRLSVWLPDVIGAHGDARVRVAPIVHAGELFGLIVAERGADDDPFDEETEAALTELGNQLGLVLRNVRLDSELQASLEELRR